jgi:hypothetical protein
MSRLLVILICVSVSSAAYAQAFKPFTRVESVCERCSGGLPYDRIVLKTGEEVKARILAENEAFLVLERYGELRAVGNDQLGGVTKNQAVQRPPGFGDQILLKDDIVLAGTIEGDLPKDADHFDIKIPGTPTPLHQPSRATVAAVFRGGKRVYVADR